MHSRYKSIFLIKLHHSFSQIKFWIEIIEEGFSVFKRISNVLKEKSLSPAHVIREEDV
jgi:hypothetical protein